MAALEERKKFLSAEAERVEAELLSAEREEREARGREECCNRVIRCLPELKYLFPSIASAELLASQLADAEQELDSVDTQSFKELENKRGELERQLNLLKKDNDRLQNDHGSLQNKGQSWQEAIDNFTL
jgi:hypothetical protein